MFNLRQTLLFSLLYALSVFAGTTGKISGVVTDKATGDPLPGVNVLLDGTLMGASTDVDGSFVILHVPAGTYTVIFNYVGYNEVKVENVRVVPDITKRLDMQLAQTTLELDQEIVIVAEKPFFEVSATNTVKVLDSEEIEKIPVKGVTQIVSLNAGVVSADGSGGETGNATINVRGGRGNETLVIVDGIPYNSAFGTGAQGTIPDNAIEQISTQLGGFSAKYGSAQSGIINIVTKSGSRQFNGSLEAISSELTDPYGYNSVNGSLSGPLIPGSKHYSFFVSTEYIKTKTDRPTAIGTVIPTANIDEPALLNAGSKVLRFTSKFDANYDNFKITLSGTGSLRETHSYIHSYAKNNSDHNPKNLQDVLGSSLRFTHFLDELTYWDLTARVRQARTESGDGVWFDNIEAYGDTTANRKIGVELPAQGSRVLQDEVGVFFDHGRVSNSYSKTKTLTYGVDFNFTRQFKSNLLEFGASWEQSQLRQYSIAPVFLAVQNGGPNQLADIDRYSRVFPFYYGYDIYGNETDAGESFSTAYAGTPNENSFRNDPVKKPVTASVYIQDKFEFKDFILNAGLRWDYFDPNTKRIKDPNNVFGFGPNATRLDPEDWEVAPAESYISPRLGFAFPVSEGSVFHAQYGIFRQPPRLVDIYTNWFSVEGLESDDNFTVGNGHLQSEKTTQYEFGFKQQFGNVASLDVTAFYKNVQGLTNIVRELSSKGQDVINYLTTKNTDFGTVKGMTFSFTLRQMGPVSARLDYTLSDAEGTGSSQSSSALAAFRNPNGEVPKSIAPLSFDQRHTLTASVDLTFRDKEGPMLGGFYPIENTGVNFLVSYNSGRPYTPLAYINVLPGAGSNAGDLTQYINSARGEGIFRIDMKVIKNIKITDAISVQPYLWIQNLLDRKNANNFYQSTGSPDNSGFLDTELGQAFANDNPDFISDYKALERNPGNFGLPRLIRLGLVLRF
ncbi:MAG: TonB-dependent receptor [Calditrichaeota bacterium]|nr:MAG: TonB-dependent receptor [Calditrichota bacterium]